jgi:hypothetical protein
MLWCCSDSIFYLECQIDLHNGASWLGQQLVILCSPLMTWLNELLKLWKIYDVLDNRNTTNHHIPYFISNVKSSPAMLDLEQTLRELGSFVKRLADDKEENIQEIVTRKKTHM